MDDAYNVQVTAGESQDVDGLEQLMALKDADTFVVADIWGDMKGGADGLFDRDTRLLSRFVMTAGLARPSRLSSGVSQDNVFFTAHSTNRPLPPMGGRSAPAGVIHIERRRFVRDRRMFERIRMVNHGVEDVLLPMAFEFAADFADIFEVRGSVRPKRGTQETPVVDGRRVLFRYLGVDEATRSSCLAFSEPPARLTASRAEFMFSLPKGRRCDLYIECGVGACEAPDETRFRFHAVQARVAMRTRRRRGASIRGPRNPRFNDWLDQSRADVALLTTDLPTGPYPYAGVPWFSTPFGRDGILTAWQMLWLDPSLAKGVLTYLAMRQATEFSAFQDSAPGKIMHETRAGEMSVLGEVPFGLYYGGVDTTCLFVALAGAYLRRTADVGTIRTLWPNLLAAVGWMKDHGDVTGDGLISYQRAADSGLSNQGWKDSEDSIFHSDGRFPKGPVALLEVQGYAFAAWQAIADMARVLADDREAEWAARAAGVRALVEDRFWMEDEQFYAIALDGDGEQCRSIGSNAGHLLFTGLPSKERARAVTKRMLAAEFRSGWGLRTLATGQARFNPMSYHNGSVWPHDTAMAAAGMAQYGERRAVALLLGEIYAAATHFQMRLPELFCGFERMPGEPPIAYPVACLPQAWAAGSVFLMLQAALGVRIDALEGVVEIDRPLLPSGIERLNLTRLEVGEAVVDLTFQHMGTHTVVMPRRTEGPVSVRTLG
ncbi:MAG: glycogen debranching N-terminal domain-containing protein [Brevundimonas sp.]|uniref:amylo-alpha-1,6-glucosidase n=1 Tax=Brevundimonas sp. TaxID=1871086 RepID=UPI002628B404|nr:glycogen debranching N-terminal domain-containing protein [Brevundimonas sp.]MDI6623684.1 glycogen debranching N-terminal domain-containing protein [Brevundimonas sp.]MDQ7812395.1 glycogen debranching N-terminal domain-containing protein [Brevundimonas sp.]